MTINDERQSISIDELEIARIISPNDDMIRNTKHENYYAAGVSALRQIILALQGAEHCAGYGDVRSILDLPCGHGRVMRWLRAHFPDADIVACDIDKDSVDFCVEHFAATPYYSKHLIRSVPIILTIGD